MMHLRLSVLPQELAVCRLDPRESVPGWIGGAFTSVTRTNEELSVVCDDARVPDGVFAERGWRCLKVEGPIPFDMTGVAASLCAPLAAAKISVFVVATYDTDYVLVKSDVLASAVAALRAAGFEVL